MVEAQTGKRAERWEAMRCVHLDIVKAKAMPLSVLA
jgi:hypothetical protein